MKTAFITGASGDIGRAIVKKFIENGYFVIGQYNESENEILNLKAELDKNGYGEYFYALKIDLSNFSDIESKIQSLQKSFLHFDVLVNNAGVDLYKQITDTSINEWEYLFNVNMTGAFLLTKLLLPNMIERKSGNIVNVSSIWGKIGASMEVAYSASKSALIGFSLALSKEVAPSNIRVNCVCPGVIDTKMNSRFNKQEINELIENTPLNKLGKVEDVAELIFFLSSEKASFITGQVITVDGGFSL